MTSQRANDSTQKLLDKILSHCDSWANCLDKSTAQLTSILNISSQKHETLSFIASPSADPSHSWQNPLTTPAILLDFPDLIPRLVAKQTKAIELALKSLTEIMEEFTKVITAMRACKKDAISKASAAFAADTDVVMKSQPASISIVEAADWIDAMVAGYEMEYGEKKEYLRRLDLRVDGGNLTTTQANWGLEKWVDFEKEVELRERLKLLKLMERQSSQR